MTRSRFVRPPSVAEYARLSQAARVAAAERALETTDQRKATYAREATEAAAAVRTVAEALLPRVHARWPDPPDVQAARRLELLNATQHKYARRAS